MSELLFGTCANGSADAALMRQTGIEWVRQNLGMPFADRLGGRLTDEYLRNKALVQSWISQGVKVMGVTPQPFAGAYEPDAQGVLRLRVKPRLPEWLGRPGTEEYNRNYEEVCAWLARDLKDQISMWQIANELDIEIFAGPLTPRQACEFIVHGARGLKRVDSSLLVGHNPAGDPPAYFLYGWLYGRGEPLLDYCGVDGYYGTWMAGGPESWGRRIAELSELTGVPVLVAEWGFASAGGVCAEGDVPADRPPCQTRKWRHTWGPGHTPEGQAAFVRECFRMFRTHREQLLGVFFYRWEDQEVCWQCGRPDCPIETRWGLVDVNGQPKPALAACREGIAMMKAGSAVEPKE